MTAGGFDACVRNELLHIQFSNSDLQQTQLRGLAAQQREFCSERPAL
jgi:hypothetical protein